MYVFDEDRVLSDESLTKMGFGQRWLMNILIKNGELPDFDTMKILIENEVMASKTLAITMARQRYHISELMSFLHLLYESIPTKDKIKEIKDVSESALEEVCLSPIDMMLDRINSKKSRYPTKIYPFIFVPNSDN